ncbi:MAG TPA: TonB-dependent receptor [Thermoanaerobaculia bacterium]
MSYSYGEEEEQQSLETTFVQEDVGFDPNVSPGSIDPDDIQANPIGQDIGAFTLDDAVFADNVTTDDELVFAVNLQRPFTRGATSGLWKVGAKYRDKSKDRDDQVFVFEGDDVFLADFLDDFDAGTFLDGRYQIGPFVGAGAARDLLASLESEQDVEEELADYDASEETAAAYGMVELAFAGDLSLLFGARLESTDTSYSAFQLVFDDEGDFAELNPVTGGDSYDELLPMAHLRYAVDEDSNVRLAVTRTLSRPNFSDLAPYELILQEDREIERGNPDLDVTTAWNVDLLYERYFTSVGVLSAGVFYKSLSDVIFLARFEEPFRGEDYDVLQPFNGDDGELTGFELVYQNTFRRLPGALSGLGVYFNYTWADSEGTLPERTVRLPGQADYVGNASISYERRGFSGRLSLNFHGEYLLKVGEEAAEDVFVDERRQLDLSAHQRINDRWSLYLELLNLIDEPFWVYEGVPDRPIQVEYYSWWGTLGFKVSF